MSKKSKSISFEPIPLTEDDDIDPGKSLDVQKLNESITKCFNKASSLVEDDYYEEDPDDFRIELKYIIHGMKDMHETIFEIYKKYDNKEKSKNLCAIPLARNQVETVYLTALIFRDTQKWLSEFQTYTWKRIAQKGLYQKEERKNLKRLRGLFDNAFMKFKNFLEKKENFKKPMTIEDFEKIENDVNEYLIGTGELYSPHCVGNRRSRCAASRGSGKRTVSCKTT